MPEQNKTIYERQIAIQRRISDAFKRDFELPENVARDIGFHMTDWLSDIRDLERTYSEIDSLSYRQITAFVTRFLAHVPNHLNAAMKLSGHGPVEDVFKVGIFEEDE